MTIQKDPRWQAVLSRDRSQDDQFYYSVKTTGVFCRPSCAARMPRPENVQFHSTPAEAEQAGFRACKRCQPDRPSLRQQKVATVAAACRSIERAEEPPALTLLASQAGLSPSHFHRVFKSVTGLTPKEYAMAHRSHRLRDELPRGGSVTEAIFNAGFNSTGRCYESSNAVLGMTPGDFRTGGANAEICFALGECSLGSILVATSSKGVCAILLGDDPEALVRDLQDRFPRAHFRGGESDFEQQVATVIGFVEAPALGLDLPLDLRGTLFQQRVWQALRQIPAGQTVSYRELAHLLGQPKSARAVAGACAANPLAVAIPCHRVVRSDGSLSGYRWGVHRKQALLERERA